MLIRVQKKKREAQIPVEVIFYILLSMLLDVEKINFCFA